MAFIVVTVAIDGSSGCSILLHTPPRPSALGDLCERNSFMVPERCIKGPMNFDLGFDCSGNTGCGQKATLEESPPAISQFFINSECISLKRLEFLKPCKVDECLKSMCDTWKSSISIITQWVQMDIDEVHETFVIYLVNSNILILPFSLAQACECHDPQQSIFNEEMPQCVYTDALMLCGIQEDQCGLVTGGGLSSPHLDWIIQLLKSMRFMLLASEA